MSYDITTVFVREARVALAAVLHYRDTLWRRLYDRNEHRQQTNFVFISYR